MNVHLQLESFSSLRCESIRYGKNNGSSDCHSAKVRDQTATRLVPKKKKHITYSTWPNYSKSVPK